MVAPDASHRWCVIMCGGVGSRFWPYSRADRPKQFIDFMGTGRSLLQMSYDRATQFVSPERVLVVTNRAYMPLIREQLPDVAEENILCEPARRNTAPCIAWAAWHIMARDPESVMLVMPSDHLITREAVFNDCIERAFAFANGNDVLLTLGIHPTRPETGYGYIQAGKPTGCRDISKVKTFTEKPDRELAQVFIDTGEFFWNSGIFAWRTGVIIDTLRSQAPEVSAIFEGGADLFGTDGEQAYIDSEFASCPSISVDYAVMESAPNVFVERVDFGWSDLGTWGSLHDNSPKSQDANVVQNCRVLAYNSHDNIFAIKEDKLVVVDSLDGYIVADSGDVLLICPKDREEYIRRIVNDVRSAYGDKYL